MQYKLGNSKYIYPSGETKKITCPKCKKETVFSVFKNRDTRLIPEFPLVKSENICFLVCPECSSAFKIPAQKAKKLKKGEKEAVESFDLEELEEYKL